MTGPQEIQLELAGVCNATCCYCTWQTRTLGKRLMDTALALRLLNEARALGVGVVRYHGLGESTVHPDLVRVAEHGEALGLNHSLSTNCRLLTGTLAEGLARLPGLALVLAIPWVMPEAFVAACIENVRDYLLSDPTNHRIHVQLVCHIDARRYYGRFVESFLPLAATRSNVFLHLKQPVTWPTDTPNQGFVEPGLAEHAKVIFDARATPLSIAKGCNQPKRFLHVLADGNCTVCCVDANDWGLGSVAQRTLKEVWTSPRRLELERLWAAADDSIPCGHCKKRTDCLQ